MRALLILATYTVYYSVIANDENNINQDFRSKEENVISVDFGPVHLHTKIRNLPEKHVPLRWDDNYATQKIVTLVNFVKSLPTLNPLNQTFCRYNVSIPDVDFGADLDIWNLTVTGIKELAVNNIEMRVTSPRIDFNVTIPRITIEADFTLNGLYESFRIFNSGHFNVTLLDLRVMAAFGPVSTRSHNNMKSVYKLDSADVTIDLKDLQLRMNMVAYAEDVKLLLNQFFQYTEDLIVDNNLLRIVLNAINHKLRKIPAKQIMQYILGTSSVSSLNGFQRMAKRISGPKYDY